MKNLKPGQKVVYRHIKIGTVSKQIMNIPADGEEVTLGNRVGPGEWQIKEYPKCRSGVFNQSFKEINIFPLKEKSNPDLYAKLEPNRVLEEQLIIQN